MKENRIIWIDTCKAIAIFCVIYGHVGLFSMDYFGFCSRLQDVFCMPLFFFISGMCQKPLEISGILPAVKKKFFRIILPFLVIGLAYTIIMKDDRGILSLFYYPDDLYHNGYWFLLVLLEFYILFYISQLLCGFLNVDKVKLGGAIMILLWILISAYEKTIGFAEVVNTVLSIDLSLYNFPFFIAGYVIFNILGRIRLEKVISSNIFSGISFSLFVFLFFLKERYDIFVFPLTYIMAFSAILTLICAVSSSSFSIPQWKYVNYCGKHTLNLYVLHYFFLPTNLSFLIPVVKGNMIVEIFLFSTITTLVIITSLSLSYILKRNSLFNSIL